MWKTRGVENTGSGWKTRGLVENMGSGWKTRGLVENTGSEWKTRGQGRKLGVLVENTGF